MACEVKHPMFISNCAPSSPLRGCRKQFGGTGSKHQVRRIAETKQLWLQSCNENWKGQYYFIPLAMSSLQIRKDRNRFPSKFFSPYFQLSKSRSSFPLIPNPESIPHRSHQFNSIPSRWTPPSLSSVPPAMQPSRRAALFAGGWSRRRSFLTSHQFFFCLRKKNYDFF